MPEDQQNDLNEALEALTEKFFTFLNASNFSTAAPEMYYDLMVGTGALLLNKGDHEQPLNYQAIPTAQLSFEEGIFGSIGGIFRKHAMPARLIEQQWKDAKIPHKLADMMNDKPTEDITLEEVTYLDPASNNWYYEVIWFEGGKTGEEVRLVTRITKYNPWIIVRWSKIAGEVEGQKGAPGQRPQLTEAEALEAQPAAAKGVSEASPITEEGGAELERSREG